jgi:hypothetical protein
MSARLPSGLFSARFQKSGLFWGALAGRNLVWHVRPYLAFSGRFRKITVLSYLKDQNLPFLDFLNKN